MNNSHVFSTSSPSSTSAALASFPFTTSTGAIACYDLSIMPTLWSEGSGFEMNSNGQVVGAIYSSGAAVKRQSRHVMARSEDGSLWFGDSVGQFHPLD